MNTLCVCARAYIWAMSVCRHGISFNVADTAMRWHRRGRGRQKVFWGSFSFSHHLSKLPSETNTASSATTSPQWQAERKKKENQYLTSRNDNVLVMNNGADNSCNSTSLRLWMEAEWNLIANHGALSCRPAYANLQSQGGATPRVCLCACLWAPIVHVDGCVCVCRNNSDAWSISVTVGDGKPSEDRLKPASTSVAFTAA